MYLYFFAHVSQHNQQVWLLCLIPVHTPCSTQWDIRIICLTSTRGTWRAPCSSAPPPRDDTPEICSVCDSNYTCDSPVRVRAPEISLTCHAPPYPSYPHTHIHAQVTDTTEGAREGVQSGLRCKTPPVCFNFHLPHHDPLQLVTQVASRCTSLLFFSSPVCPRIPSRSSIFLSSPATLYSSQL